MDPNVEKLEWLVEVMEDVGGFSDVFSRLPKDDRIIQWVLYVDD